MVENKVKVLHVIKGLGRGGAEVLLLETLKAHDKEKFSWGYCYLQSSGDELSLDLKKEGGDLYPLNIKNTGGLLKAIFDLRAIVKNEDIDVIHAHLPISGVIARLVGLMTNTPVIYTEHNLIDKYHWLTKIANKITYNLNTVAIPVSEKVHDSINEVFGEPKRKFAIAKIKNAVNTQQFSPDYCKESGSEIRSSLGISEEALVLGTVAVFSEQKRLDLFLDVAKQLKKMRDDIHFILVGDGKLYNSLVKKSKSLGIDDIVHFVGRTNEVRPYLCSMDIYMMTSDFEGLPIALLEAMSMGKVPAVTNAGGIGEVVKHEDNGLLVEVGDLDRLIKSITSIWDNDEKLNRLSRNARNTIIKDYSIERMCNELECLYSNNL